MTLLGTRSTVRDLASALRADHAADAARLAVELGLPARLLTNRGLGPRGSVPMETAADALAVVASLAASASGAGQPAVAGMAARRHRLGDPAVLDLVADEVEAAAVPGMPAAHPWAAGIAAIEAAGLREPALRAAALLLRARAAEGAGHIGQARMLVEQSLAAAPGLLPAVRDAAEYELCAGNWARAWELADSIRSDRIAEPMLRSLSELRWPAAGPGKVSRNRPCPCGLGRKYKACCLQKDQLGLPHPLSLRAEALYAMIASYAQRAPRSQILDRVIACAIGAPEAAMLALDLAVFDGGAARRFLADRGHLLRPDERDLLDRWLTVPVDLYEVTWVRPGSELRLRSLVGGPQYAEQRDRLFSLSVGRLDLVVARLLPDGTRLRALGGIASIRRDYRHQACALFPRGPVLPGRGDDFPERLLSVFSQQPRQRFATADGEEYRFCETTMTTADPAAAWAALQDQCMAAPEQPIEDVAGYRAFLGTLPGRWWCQPAEDSIDHIGSVEPGILTNLGTIRHGPAGSLILTANSEPRAAALAAHVTKFAHGAAVTAHSARTAQELIGEPEDPSAEPDSGQAERRRHGVKLVPPRPVTLIMEEYFLPLQLGLDDLAAEITRAHSMDKMLAKRDEDGLTPTEAAAAGGAALDRLRALLDDCEWRRRCAHESGDQADILPDPDELRRRIGLPPARNATR
jgi:hypothetical protein